MRCRTQRVIRLAILFSGCRLRTCWELLENGKVVRQTKINRWSVGGVFGAFKGTCTILERSADAISKDLSRWVRNASYAIVDEPAPKEAVESPMDAPRPVEATPSDDPQPTEKKEEK